MQNHVAFFYFQNYYRAQRNVKSIYPELEIFGETTRKLELVNLSCPLLQIKPARPRQLQKMTKRLKHVTRPYGGCLSAAAVRERIVRAFLIEEQKIVARVLKAKLKAEKK